MGFHFSAAMIMVVVGGTSISDGVHYDQRRYKLRVRG